MEILTLLMAIVVGAILVRNIEQKKRIALLASYLGNYQIEKLMESLTQGYLRCLGESDLERRAQIWSLLDQTEQSLGGQFQKFAADFAQVAESDARVSKIPVALPFVQRLIPAMTFDVRKAFAIHAKGLADVAGNAAGLNARDKAYMMSAELFLMQHTCHWYCKSKTVASARMMARHQTTHAQLVASVSSATRRAYLSLV